MTVGDLVNLQMGDILQTGKPVSGEMVIQVEGQNKFAGRLGRHKDHVAVRVTRLAEVEESL